MVARMAKLRALKNTICALMTVSQRGGNQKELVHWHVMYPFYVS